MNQFDQILNQKEAAKYITGQDIRMTAPMLSELTNTGLGPRFHRKGNQKLFLIGDVNQWVEQEKLRRKSA